MQLACQLVCEYCGAAAPLVEMDMPDDQYLAWQQGMEDAEADQSRQWERAGPAKGGVQ